jgi:hypothetical protein
MKRASSGACKFVRVGVGWSSVNLLIAALSTLIPSTAFLIFLRRRFLLVWGWGLGWSAEGFSGVVEKGPLESSGRGRGTRDLKITDILPA